MKEMKDMRLVVISGPSGAGKSTAIKVLEDLGFFCVDNMPVTLLPKFLELLGETEGIIKVAAVVDVREREFLREFPSIFKEIRNSGYKVELVYLDASDESLVRRFSETRRRHPIDNVDSPLQGIKAERELLREIRAGADMVVDSTNYNVHELKIHLKEHFSQPLSREKMTINLISFGYRHGIPGEADIVMDVRFLSNPHFMVELRGLNGKYKEVREFVFSKAEAVEFIERFGALMNFLIPLYGREGKSYLTVAIGCTGGKHRSVAVAERLKSDMPQEICVLKVRHRDMDKI